MQACWECGTVGEVHHHHPVPKSRGGTRTIPLCLLCHGKAHGRRMSTSDLTKEGMQRAKARGVVLGKRPYGETAEERAMIAAAVKLRASGRTLEEVSADLAAQGMLSRRGVPLSVSTLFEIFRRAEQPKQPKQLKQPEQPKQLKQPEQPKQPGRPKHAVQVGPAFSRQALRAGSILDRSKLHIG